MTEQQLEKSTQLDAIEDAAVCLLPAGDDILRVVIALAMIQDSRRYTMEDLIKVAELAGKRCFQKRNPKQGA